MKDFIVDIVDMQKALHCKVFMVWSEERLKKQILHSVQDDGFAEYTAGASIVAGSGAGRFVRTRTALWSPA